MNKYDLLKTIDDKESKVLISNIMDLAENAIDKGIVTYTSFLSPTIVSKIIEIYKHENINMEINGGYENAERVTIAFYNDYNKDDIAYPISLLKISYNKKYSRELKHGDFLGSIMGLSIDRSMIGDIIILDDAVYVFVLSKMEDFIIQNLKKVSNQTVRVSVCNNDIEIFQKEYEILKTTVTSTRLDVVISKIFNISRSNSKELIEKGKVFVNWTLTEDATLEIKDNTIITVRGEGRIKFVENIGLNKKGKIVISYIKY